MPTEITVMSKYAAFAEKSRKAEAERDLYRPPATPRYGPFYRCRILKIDIGDGTFNWKVPKPGGTLPAYTCAITYEIQDESNDELDEVKWTGKIWTMPNVDDKTLAAAFGCAEPVPFAKVDKGTGAGQWKHVQITHSQYKGLIETLLDKEGEDFDPDAEMQLLKDEIADGKVVMVEVGVVYRENPEKEMIFEREKIKRLLSGGGHEV